MTDRRDTSGEAVELLERLLEWSSWVCIRFTMCRIQIAFFLLASDRSPLWCINHQRVHRTVVISTVTDLLF
jgi:hypothetical protein